MTQPQSLAGIRVADFSRVLAGPHATMILADLGADVLKIERPGVGDDTRNWGPPWYGDMATYFMSVNRNKRSIALDLSDPADRARAIEIVRESDVVIENFKSGTMDKLGLGYDVLSAEQPGLVYCSITGYGNTGGAHLSGYDLVVQAAGGLMSITGPADGEPTKVGVALVDIVTGLHATIGILAALRHRDLTGVGQRVDVNLLSSLLSALTNQSSAYLLTGKVPGRMGNQHPSIAPYQPMETADRPLAIAATGNGQFIALLRGIGREDLLDDPRFATNAERVAHRDALIPELEKTFREHTADHWFAVLTEHGVPCAPINDLEQAFALAESLGLDPVVYPSDPDADPKSAQVRNPISMSVTPPQYRTAPQDLPA